MLCPVTVEANNPKMCMLATCPMIGCLHERATQAAIDVSDISPSMRAAVAWIKEQEAKRG